MMTRWGRGLVARILAEAGYAVLPAGDAEEELALAGTLEGRFGVAVVGSGSS